MSAITMLGSNWSQPPQMLIYAIQKIDSMQEYEYCGYLSDTQVL